MSYLNLFIATLLTITFSLHAHATTSINTLSVTSTAVKKVEGGPRTVIQAMTDVTVYQPTSGNLYIKIVNSEGSPVIETETGEVSIVISLEGLDSGVYTLETIDDNEDYQEFTIIVE